MTVRTQCLQKNYLQSRKSEVGGERPQDRCEILLNPFVPDAHFGTAVTVFSPFLEKAFEFSYFANPQAPVAQKIADEVIFRRFQGEGVFFKSDLTDTPQIFDAQILENTDLSPFRFHFSVG